MPWKVRSLRSSAFIAAVAGLVFLAGCSPAPEPPPEPTSEEPPASPAPAVVEARPELNLDERGRALRGYDPVAYFTEGNAIAGSPEIHEVWDGAHYFFQTEEHRQTFLANPGAYLPAHGGFCTFGIVLEKKFDGDPEVWLIRNDQLHIFLNREVQAKFQSDEEANLARVQANWPQIRSLTAEELEAQPGLGEDPA